MAITTPASATIEPPPSPSPPSPSARRAGEGLRPPSRGANFGIAGRDAALAGLVALLLALPVWSHKTVDQPDGLGLERRWWLVIGVVAAVFMLRLTLQFFFWSREDGSERLVRFVKAAAIAGVTAGILMRLAWLLFGFRHDIRIETVAWLATTVGLVAGLLLTPGVRSILDLKVASALQSRPGLGLALAAEALACVLTLVPLLGRIAPAFIASSATMVRAVAVGLLAALLGAVHWFVGGDYQRLVRSMALVTIMLIAVAFPYLPFANRYLIVVAILILIYVMLGWGLNVVVGLAGLLDLGYVAFYAVGAYSFALIAKWYDLSFWICLPLAGLFAAAWGILLGFPVLRLRGDYLAIVTLAFGEIIRLILINWQAVTGGPAGVGRIPGPTFPVIRLEDGWPRLVGLEFKDEGPNQFAQFFGIDHVPVHRFIFLYYIILLLALITNFVTLRLRRLPIGRAWEALREDEIACRSLGINTTNTKLTAFAIGAMFGGLAGSFYATWQGFISPESFVFMESAIILSIVVLGGMGSQMGVAAAAVVMIGGIEVLRNLEFANTLYKEFFDREFDPNEYRMLVFGIAMVLIMLFKPRGFVGARTPSVFLKERKGIGAANVREGHG